MGLRIAVLQGVIAGVPIGKIGTDTIYLLFLGRPLDFGISIRSANPSNLITKDSFPAGYPVFVQSLIRFNATSSSGIERYSLQSFISLSKGISSDKSLSLIPWT